MEHVPLTSHRALDHNPCMETLHQRIKRRIAELEAERGETVSFRSISLAGGLSDGGLSKLLRNEDDSPTLETLTKLARGLEVSPTWLAFGESADADGPEIGREIPVRGLVGAGAVVEQIGDPSSWIAPPGVAFPMGRHVGALLVVGDSQEPRFHAGEFLLYDSRSVAPADLVDQFAIVQTLDERRLIKIIRQRGGGDNWLLESINGRPEITGLLGAWRFLGVLAKPGQEIPQREKKKKRLLPRPSPEVERQ